MDSSWQWKFFYECADGPWAGKKLFLDPSSGLSTYVFSVRDWRGRYIGSDPNIGEIYWCPARVKEDQIKAPVKEPVKYHKPQLVRKMGKRWVFSGDLLDTVSISLGSSDEPIVAADLADIFTENDFPVSAGEMMRALDELKRIGVAESKYMFCEKRKCLVTHYFRSALKQQSA